MKGSSDASRRGLDYTDPAAAANFRDVGEFMNLIAGRTILPRRRLFRGGTIKAISDPSVIGSPRTIFCLQKGPDHDLPGIRNLHFPISNDYEKYDTSIPEVRAWLRGIVGTVEAGVAFPLYVHCLSGRDRTGVAVAVFLKICGAENAHIMEEYGLSIGTEDRPLIHLALEGLGDLGRYFRGIDLAKVRDALQGRTPPTSSHRVRTIARP